MPTNGQTQGQHDKNKIVTENMITWIKSLEIEGRKISNFEPILEYCFVEKNNNWNPW